MTVLLTLSLFCAPALGVATLLSGLDPAARAVVSAVGSLVIVSLVAEVMLVTSLWSPGGGLVAVLLIGGAFAALSRLRG